MTPLPRNLIALAAVCLAACATAPKPPVATTPAATSPKTPETSRPAATLPDVRGGEAEAAPAEPLAEGPIYYELDSARLRPDSQRTLDRLAEELRRRREATVLISGHTCELGTTEYNLVLGQKRANAAREYLVRLGVEPERISTVSSGEERPADSGSGEAAWAKNRRSEFSFSVANAGRADRN
jgi:peptidoglycan-associated lipoprotein